MAYVTLEDIRNKSVDEILQKMSRPYEVVEKHPTSGGKDKVKGIKRKLANFFAQDSSSLKTGEILHIEDSFLLVTSVVPSSGRIFFRLLDGGTIFSVPRWFLTGQKIEFKFKKGDHVTLNGQEYTIRYVEPASNSVQLDMGDGKLRRAGISKICMVKAFEASGEELRKEN